MRNRLRLVKVFIFVIIIALIFSTFIFVKDLAVAAGTNHIVNLGDKQEIDPFSVLLIGTDADRNDGGGARSDVLMVATVNPNNERGNMEVDIISIPRDTVAYITCADTYDKINSAYSYGQSVTGSKQDAIDCTVDTVSNLLNIPIDYYMDFSFNAAIEIIDAIGGIEIYVEEGFCEQDSQGNGEYSSDPNNCVEGSVSIPSGQQTLNGEQAVAYARSRYGSSDYERNMRQQEVLAATAKKIISDPVAYATDVLEIYQEYVTSNIDISSLTKFANLAVSMFNDTMQSVSSSSPLVINVVSSPFATTTSIESALSAFSGINLDNVEAIPASEVLDTTTANEQYKEVKQIYVSKKATPIPSKAVSEEQAEATESVEIEIQSMSILSQEMSLPGGWYSYIGPETLYYVSNELRSCLELEPEEPTFDYVEASYEFGYDMTQEMFF